MEIVGRKKVQRNGENLTKKGTPGDRKWTLKAYKKKRKRRKIEKEKEKK
jgi:hypothetical protein